MSVVQRICHYCLARATTKDHIVPRFLVRELSHRVNVCGLYMQNTVPSCDDCNQEKGNGRGPCDCRRCVWAWDLYSILCEAAGMSIPA